MRKIECDKCHNPIERSPHILKLPPTLPAHANRAIDLCEVHALELLAWLGPDFVFVPPPPAPAPTPAGFPVPGVGAPGADPAADELPDTEPPTGPPAPAAFPPEVLANIEAERAKTRAELEQAAAAAAGDDDDDEHEP